MGEHSDRTQGVAGWIPPGPLPIPPTAANLGRMFSQDDPERQANIAFALIVLAIVAVGALTIWLFYGTQL